MLLVTEARFGNLKKCLTDKQGIQLKILKCFKIILKKTSSRFEGWWW